MRSAVIIEFSQGSFFVYAYKILCLTFRLSSSAHARGQNNQLGSSFYFARADVRGCVIGYFARAYQMRGLIVAFLNNIHARYVSKEIRTDK